MLPNRVVIEVFPPLFDDHEYGYFADCIGLNRILFRVNGEISPACKKRPNSKKCKGKGLKDRNFTVSIHDTKVHVWNALAILNSEDEY